MADLRCPIGSPRPGDVDFPSLLIERERAEILRGRDPVAPPDELEATGFIMPRALWREIQADAARIDAGAVAVRQDARDLTFNTRVQGARETVINRFAHRSDAELMEETTAATAWLQRREELRVEMEQFIKQFISQGQMTADFFIASDQPESNALIEAAFAPSRGQRVIGGEAVSIDTLRTTRMLYSLNHERKTGWLYSQTAKLMGAAFDGRRFIRYLSSNLGAAIDTGFGLNGDYAEAQQRNSRQWDRMYEMLPKPVQFFIDQMSPADLAIIIASGGLSGLLARSRLRRSGRGLSTDDLQERARFATHRDGDSVIFARMKLLELPFGRGIIHAGSELYSHRLPIDPHGKIPQRKTQPHAAGLDVGLLERPEIETARLPLLRRKTSQLGGFAP